MKPIKSSIGSHRIIMSW